ncbi:MAG: hypothetical protein MJ252_26020 [archaeon]|nr:hypothetical protein [archaeon]
MDEDKCGKKENLFYEYEKDNMSEFSSTLTAIETPKNSCIWNKYYEELQILEKPLHCPSMLQKKIIISKENIEAKEDHLIFRQNFPLTNLNHIHSPQIFNGTNLKLEVSKRFKRKLLTVCYYTPIKNSS